MITPTHDWQPGEFFKSSFSGPEPQKCVEVAKRPGAVAVRNSTHPFGQGLILEFTEDEWAAFKEGVVDGQF